MVQQKIFKLDVWTDRCCRFQLSGESGTTLSVKIDYPTVLMESYQQWRDAYLNYYQKLRGRAISQGDIPPPEIDWQEQLDQRKTVLLTQLNRWLGCRELQEIRNTITKAANCQSGSFWVDVLLCCNSPEFARLPWEWWEIATDLGAGGKIRITRQPENIRGEPVKPIARKARILAILGDNTGLDFEKEKNALKSLRRITKVEFLNSDKKEEIRKAIADERGWDILFFAGHSNETPAEENAGGELKIAPGVFMAIADIKESLILAKKRGLQFAIFNSCDGIDIAKSLIDIGLNQVVVMREPIHNDVAAEFLIVFVKELANYKDVAEALVDACDFLLKKNHQYPSAALVPSLFRHPGSELFRIEPLGFWQQLKRLTPKGKDALILNSLLLISLLLPVQEFLLDWRILVQAIYRDFTAQNASGGRAQILLVQIDEKSIEKAEIKKPYPMETKYLAKLIDRLAELDGELIGIDYVLNRYNSQAEGDIQLKDAIQKAVKYQNTWFVFFKDEREGLRVNQKYASLNWSLEGDISIDLKGKYVTLLRDVQWEKPQFFYRFPFAYMLAFSSELKSAENNDLPQPNLKSELNFYQQLYDYRKGLVGEKPLFEERAYLKLITVLSWQLKQRWLDPIIDYSVNYEGVYNCIPAWRLLAPDDFIGKGEKQKCEIGNIDGSIKERAIIIASGGYDEAEDTINEPPLAFRYRSGKRKLTGGEVHAYTLHHLLANRLVISIPDFFVVLAAVFLGRNVALVMENYRKRRSLLGAALIGVNLIYVAVSLQFYISKAILLPIILPSLAFWFCLKPGSLFNKIKKRRIDQW